MADLSITWLITFLAQFCGGMGLAYMGWKHEPIDQALLGAGLAMLTASGVQGATANITALKSRSVPRPES